MTTTLGHALLGLLARKPGTGYDLAARLRRPVGYFWSARHSQIYPELARLEEDRLVQHSVIDGAGPRATKRYRITAAGRRSLRAWLRATTADVDDKEILLRVYLLFALRPDEAVDVVRAIREHHERSLEHFRRTATDEDIAIFDDQDFGPELLAAATLRWGITFDEQRIRWCEWLLEQLDSSRLSPAAVARGAATQVP